jgi:hypothetical protein
MDHALTSRRYQNNLKKTIAKLFFLFHLGNGMFIINVTQSTFPLTVEFDVCQVLPCGDLMSQLQLRGYSFYVSHPETHREAWYLSRVDGSGVKHWV